MEPGAIFGCPARSRDLDFAKKYKLDIIPVVKSETNKETNDNIAYSGEGIIIDSDFLDGLSVDKAKEKIIEIIENKKIGKKRVSFRLKDWGVSRQRY